MLVMSPERLPLGSSQPPSEGGVVAELVRRYSVAWHMCAPGNSAAHSACILCRPPASPAVVAVVKPEKRTLAMPLQQASGREDVQSEPRVMPAATLTQVEP